MSSNGPDDLRDPVGHRNHRYDSIGEASVSWFQAEPTVSLELLDALGVKPADSVIDVGGGASNLVDHLLARGLDDVTVLDLSDVALDLARARVGDDAPVTWAQADVCSWTPARTWDVWHDRAVLHFLLGDDDRQRYLDAVSRSIEPGGAVVIGVFAADGPESCSALPVRRSSPEELREFVAALLDIRVEMRAEHQTPSGAIQPFNWIAGRILG